MPLIRVGIVPGSAIVRLTADGRWRLGIVGSDLVPTLIERWEEWSFRPATEAGGAVVEVSDRRGVVRGVVADTIFAYPEDRESGPLRIDGRPYRGELLLWASGDRLTAVNVIDLESYLYSVLPAELGPQPPERNEALRAQAVAARSYTLANLGRWRSRGYDLAATVQDQVYGGIASERPACSEAVDDTRGVVAVYDGRPILAYYSSTCGGHTATPDEVWHKAGAPYLEAVRDRTGRVEQSFCAASPWFHWSEEWSGSEFEAMLGVSLPRLRSGWSAARAGRLQKAEIRNRSDSERVSCLRLSFEHGDVDLSGDEIRWALRRPGSGEALRSALLLGVDTRFHKGRLSKLRIRGQGYGHGVGLCQFGAMGMAKAGYRYDTILRFYYRNTELRRYY